MTVENVKKSMDFKLLADPTSIAINCKPNELSKSKQLKGSCSTINIEMSRCQYKSFRSGVTVS